jgi:hypothetical protein
MHVVIHLSKFYDWQPVPRDVAVTPEDIAAGKVMPDRSGGFRARVLREPPGGTEMTCYITEADVVGKIIHEKTDVRRAGRTFSRRQAVAHIIQDHLLEGVAEWSWIKKVEVHDDGPDKDLALTMLEPHTKARHGRRNGMNIAASDVAAHMKAYLEPTQAEDHVAHLHQHFGVGVKP